MVLDAQPDLEVVAEAGDGAEEAQVVKLIAEGHTSREIWELLVISEKTVERHRANVLEKLRMRGRVGTRSDAG